MRGASNLLFSSSLESWKRSFCDNSIYYFSRETISDINRAFIRLSLRAGQDCYGSGEPPIRGLFALASQAVDKELVLRTSSEPYQGGVTLGIARIFGRRNETMTSTESVTGAWRPQTESERQLVRSQLERIVSDSRFAASKRYPCLLRYIVEQTLADNEDHLKERTLGVEVFHRPPDYDTNLDPVVRLCAGEVRKRLAQYYQSPAHASELRIELNPGSYVPVFLQSTPDVHALEVNPRSHAYVPAFSQAATDALTLEVFPAELPSKSEQVSQPNRTRKTYWRAGLVASGVIIVVVLVLGTRYWRHFEKQKSALEEVWSPLLTSSKPILFCVGETELYAPHDSLTELQSGADDDSFLQAFADKNDFVPFSDVQILTRFVSLIGAHRHAFRVQNSRTTVSPQLREGPVVLIGALNNQWTLNRTSSLRFHLEGPEGPDRVYWIADTQQPESRAWQVRAQAPRSQVVKDYAIAARFTDESTGQVVLVAAGIAGSGTRAAGEFLTDEASLKQLVDGAGVDWGNANFEVVLSSQVVNGLQGKARVEAKTFW